MKLTSQHIVITSNEPWGEMWYSKQQYAHQLSKQGNTVYFVNPVAKWKLKNLLHQGIQKKQVADSVYVLNYCNLLPLRFLPRFAQKLNEKLNWRKLEKVFPQNTALILWQFDLFRFASLIKRKNITRIYHVVDSYMHHRNDKRIAAVADLIICTSRNYLPYYKQWEKRCIHIPHAIADEELIVEEEKVRKLKTKYGSFIILTGTVGLLSDVLLIRRIALEHPQKLIVAGPVNLPMKEFELWQQLVDENKLTYVGIIPSTELKNWISAASLCIVAYKFDLTKTNFGSSSSLKLLNYLAQKKPIISTLDGEIDELQQKAIYTAKNEEDFMDYLSLGLQGKLIVDEIAVTEFIQKRNYTKLLGQIEKSLRDA